MCFRGSGEAESESLCTTIRPIPLKPRVMRNKDHTWKFVVNMKGFEQQITFEHCRR